MQSPFAGWDVCEDLSPAVWFAQGLQQPFTQSGPFRVRSVVPASFDAYARLVHPAYDLSGQAIQLRHVHEPQRQRWGGDARFPHQTGWPEGPSGADIWTPTIGTPDMADLDVLADLLSAWTTSPECLWALMWPGWGTSEATYLHRHAPKVRVGRETFALLRGRVSTIGVLARTHGMDQAPSYWWPDDRAWAVGTDLDDFSSYIAADEAAIAALLRDDRLECYPASPDDACFPKPYAPRAT